MSVLVLIANMIPDSNDEAPYKVTEGYTVLQEKADEQLWRDWTEAN